MITKQLIENLGFYKYTDNKGNIIFVMLNGSNYKFPISLHDMEKEYVSFKQLFGEIKCK